MVNQDGRIYAFSYTSLAWKGLFSPADTPEDIKAPVVKQQLESI
jgi:hypothetical protein